MYSGLSATAMQAPTMFRRLVTVSFMCFSLGLGVNGVWSKSERAETGRNRRKCLSMWQLIRNERRLFDREWALLEGEWRLFDRERSLLDDERRLRDRERWLS